VLLLEKKELLDTAINIVSYIISGVSRIMFFNIGPRVRHIYLPSIGVHIGKGIQHMRQLVDREITRIEAAAIDYLGKSVNTTP
jgi:hypothetical protein